MENDSDQVVALHAVDSTLAVQHRHSQISAVGLMSLALSRAPTMESASESQIGSWSVNASCRSQILCAPFTKTTPAKAGFDGTDHNEVPHLPQNERLTLCPPGETAQGPRSRVSEL